jgi:hypothetical protein
MSIFLISIGGREMSEPASRVGKVVSVSNELRLIMDAIDGVHHLTRQWIESRGVGTNDVPDTISALLVLLVERLRFLDRVARGVVDPRLAWCLENDTEHAPGDPSEDDLRLTAWSDAKLARHHRAEWKRAKRRLRSRKGGTKTPAEVGGP